MKKYILLSVLGLFGLVLVIGGIWFYQKYVISTEMNIPVTEYTNFEYPENPAARSTRIGQYAQRKLTLIKRDETHFDFVLEPTDPRTAKIIFKNIDVSLMTPSRPEWTKTDPGNERIALTDRQWNRQQVSFQPTSPHIEITGGDGFEKENISSVEIAKNCLNAGLWEILLFTKENDRKVLYYQGWFRFPLGHYRDLFEHNTGISYLKYWYILEHWFDPEGTPLRLDELRKVVKEIDIKATFDPNEKRMFSGEQVRKERTTNSTNLITWGDMVSGAKLEFASFIPPGRYSVKRPWKNEFWRIKNFNGASLKTVTSPASSKPLHELELVFSDEKGEKARFLVSGFELSSIPQLATNEYDKGIYMPMGIGVPPFGQSYEDLKKNPPDKSPYFSVLLDSENRWLNHHDIAIDGPIIHRDKVDPNVLHVYLLSYERHTLVGHYVITIPETELPSIASAQ